MEFDELKKIWDAQNNEPLYAINEKALHNRILLKKKNGYHITNISELLGIIAYTVTGCFIFAVNISRQNGNIFMYILSGWMLCSALYVMVARIRRIKGDHQFDRSMRGDLTHAISTATYQVILSRVMRWNTLPIGILTVLAVWDSGKSVWFAAGILIFFIVTGYASGWEHNIYKNKKRELQILQSKLDSEDPALQN